MGRTKLTPDDIKFIINVLRQGTVKWPGRAECLKKARKKVRVGYTKKGLPVFKFHWRCAICSEWAKNEKQMEVDHIVEIGSFGGDWTDFIDRMYDAGRMNLQAVCKMCHMKKTMAYNSARTRWTRK